MSDTLWALYLAGLILIGLGAIVTRANFSNDEGAELTVGDGIGCGLSVAGMLLWLAVGLGLLVMHVRVV